MADKTPAEDLVGVAVVAIDDRWSAPRVRTLKPGE